MKIAIIDIMYSFQFEFVFFYILNFKTQHALNALFILCMKQKFMEWK